MKLRQSIKRDNLLRIEELEIRVKYYCSYLEKDIEITVPFSCAHDLWKPNYGSPERTDHIKPMFDPHKIDLRGSETGCHCCGDGEIDGDSGIVIKQRGWFDKCVNPAPVTIGEVHMRIKCECGHYHIFEMESAYF